MRLRGIGQLALQWLRMDPQDNSLKQPDDDSLGEAHSLTKLEWKGVARPPLGGQGPKGSEGMAEAKRRQVSMKGGHSVN